MPLYEFVCPAGHRFEQHCKIDGSDLPTSCPHVLPEGGDEGTTRCGAPVEKVISRSQGFVSWKSPMFPGYSG